VKYRGIESSNNQVLVLKIIQSQLNMIYVRSFRNQSLSSVTITENHFSVRYASGDLKQLKK